MKILITGVTGFIGKHLSNQLSHLGFELVALTRKEEPLFCRSFVDDGNTLRLIEFFKEERFDGVIHLASCFIAEHKTSDLENLIQSNVLFGTRLLEAATQTNVRWFINTGTFWQHYENKDYSPVNLYAATKQAFDTIAAFYLETSSLIFSTIKLSDTYGPGDTRSKVFNLWMKNINSNEKLGMSGGEQFIDIVHIDDVVMAYVKLIEILNSKEASSVHKQDFAVSSGRSMRLRDLADVFEKATHSKLNIEWGARPYRKREVMKTWSKGESVPGWGPCVSLEQGIAALFKK